jgi:hypothetical protein
VRETCGQPPDPPLMPVPGASCWHQSELITHRRAAASYHDAPQTGTPDSSSVLRILTQSLSLLWHSRPSFRWTSSRWNPESSDGESAKWSTALVNSLRARRRVRQGSTLRPDIATTARRAIVRVRGGIEDPPPCSSATRCSLGSKRIHRWFSTRTRTPVATPLAGVEQGAGPLIP